MLNTGIITMDDKILLGHGSGGRLMHDLIANHFLKYLGNEYSMVMGDSTVLPEMTGRIAMTTDSFVVDPIFFPGGDIGKLAICGTVNDLAVSGARPLYLTVGFIIEEGFPVKDLETILQSMSTEAKQAGIKIVSGDTKVVDKGKCDKIFINTSGVGIINEQHLSLPSGNLIKPEDVLIVNGTLGDHGMAIMASRKSLNFQSTIESDCASLDGIIKNLLDQCRGIRFMRDPTRGGLASVLCEIADKRNWGIEIDEDTIPVDPRTRGLCEMLGFDPVYVANEGKFVLVIDREEAETALGIIKIHPLGANASVIGRITYEHPGRVLMNTQIGGKRILDMLAGEQLPRIC
jgi:hydrogenase expression/formation protein HypE